MALLSARTPRLAQTGLAFLTSVAELPDLCEKFAASGVIEATVALLTYKDERLRVQALVFITKLASHGTNLPSLLNRFPGSSGNLTLSLQRVTAWCSSTAAGCARWSLSSPARNSQCEPLQSVLWQLFPLLVAKE